MNIEIRQATREELSCVNDRYSDVGFVHSDYDNELIALALVDGVKTGIGRLVSLDSSNLELGGIYVPHEFKGDHIATAIARYLVEHIEPKKNAWCITFVDLIPIYKKYGFEVCTDLKNAPEQMLDKLLFCKQEYEKDVSLLVRKEQKRSL
jgi:hypothetical protein